MRCRYCKGELIHHYASAYKCDNCGRVFDMFEEESFEDLKNQIAREKGGNIVDKKLKVLELFAGTRSIGKAFEKNGHEVYSVEWDRQHKNINLYADMRTVTSDQILEEFGRPDIIWASPPCEKFSVAAIGKHWHQGTNLPKTEETKEALALLEYTVNLIKELDPKYYFIENPRGKMRKVDVMQSLPMYTVTYCQYGDTRMKPTDIWTNHPDPQFKPACKNGMPCHVSAPRGSRTGTQGLKGSVLRSVIPSELCDHIATISEI